MKDLKNICNINIPNSLHSLLEASILGDIEKTLSEDPIEKIYKEPSIKDFKRDSLNRYTYLIWPCKHIIQPYIDKLPHNDIIYKYMDPGEKIIGLRFDIHVDNLIEVSVTTDSNTLLKITGVGDNCENKPVAKKEIIAFCKKLIKNPELMQKVVDYANKCAEEIKRYSIADHIRLKDVI